MVFSRQEYWSDLPFLSPVDHILSDLSTMSLPSWVAPRAWHSFIELDKAAVLVWVDWLVFCEYGFSVFALWCPLATPTVLLGFLLPWVWCSSSGLLQQSAAISPYLGWRVSPHHCPSWLSTWDSSSRPSCARSATAPWTWGWSSRPPPLASGVGEWGSSSCPPPLACGLGAWVALPSRRPWPRTWGNSSRHHPWPQTRGIPSRHPWPHAGYLLSAVPALSWSSTLSHCPWSRTWGNSSRPRLAHWSQPPAL